MTPEEIKQELRQLDAMLKRLSDEGNILWEQKNDLRSEYKRITGESI